MDKKTIRSTSADRPETARGRRQSHVARLATAVQQPIRRHEDDGKRARGAEVRERVLHAALECFGVFGFEGTSTRAIAARAELSHPLLLYHFESKERLWMSMMEDVVGHYREQLESRLARVPPGDAAAGVQAFIDNFVRFSARVPQLHRIMTQESTQGSDRIRWVLEQFLRDSFVQICKLIRRAQAEGKVRKGDPARLYYAIIGLGGTLFSVSTEFRELTGRDVFAESELKQTIRMIAAFVFV